MSYIINPLKTALKTVSTLFFVTKYLFSIMLFQHCQQELFILKI